MRKLIINILLFIVSIFLLSTIGVYGLIYTFIRSLVYFRRISFVKYWADLFYSINVGIDKIGNVILSMFLNKYAIHNNNNNYPFGNLDHTISHVLAYNQNIENLTKFGKFIVNILELLDPGHMKKSL